MEDCNHTGRKLISILFLVFFSLVFLCRASVEWEGKVKIWEEDLVIPTYLIGQADKLPRFYEGRAYQGAKGPVYPYPMYDKLTDVRQEKSYKALYLENDYIQLCVLPEIGGRIFSALDKSNNYDFFYRQHVIKPALIGMLGAWLSGGVEWNIPHHHRATSFLPVDYVLEENHDGSKTIWVGELELRHRMTWLVGLTLYPDRSFIEATIKIFNRTPYAHSILCWANVAVHTNEDYQIIFPPGTEFATYHGKNQFSEWPVSRQIYNRVDYTKGVDISWWKNHPSATSLFAWNYEDDFLAGYDHGREAGVVHVADHHLVPGKKFWTWGTGERGKMWEEILTETDGPYIELMVGAFSDNQPDYSWLQPYELRTVKQYWYPIHNIKGVKQANIEAAVNLEMNSPNSVEIGFVTTRQHEGAKARIELDGEKVHEEIFDIGPSKPFIKNIALSIGIDKDALRVVLLSPDGDELIGYQSVKRKGRPLPEPVKPAPSPETIQSLEELYQAGLRLEQVYSPVLEPDPYYDEILKRDPGNVQANTALGIQFLKRGKYEEAEKKFRLALKRATHNYTSPKDGEAFYYLGVVLRAQKKYSEAYEAFYKATWSQAWSGASNYSLAELACLKNDYKKGLEFCDKSVMGNAENLKCLNLKTTILRKLGRFKEADKLACDVLKFYPLDFWAGNELYLVQKQAGLRDTAQDRLGKLVKAMRGSVQSYLELAVDYGNCGFWDEAADVLQRISGQSEHEASSNPLLDYYMAYYLEQKSDYQKALEFYQKASQKPADYCFPFRAETVDVLLRAQEINPEDGRAAYYLGNILFDLQPDIAVEHWERSVSIDDSFYLSQRNLGMATARVENDIPKAVQHMENAAKLNPEEPRLYYELDLLYETAKKHPLDRLKLLTEHHDIVKQRDDSYSREILLLVETGDYIRAIELLQNHHFHVWEGGGQIHNVYVDAHIFRGHESLQKKQYDKALQDYLKALEYPKNLEVGRPAQGGRAAQIFYFIGVAHEALGNTDQAKAYYLNSVESKRGFSELSYFQALSLEKLEKRGEALEIYQKLIDLGKERIETSTSLDFFIKFGEKQSAAKRLAQAHYLLGLGYLGQGKSEKAHAEFKETLDLNINHIWAKYYLDQLE